MRFLRSRDCYSDPRDVYRTARARGMDLVTITDHDSIDGCLELLDRHPDLPDFFVSEEVSCRFPDHDVDVHLGVYGLDERLHRELQPLRRNVFEVIAALRQSGTFFVLNHLLHFYRGQIPLADYLRLLDHVSALEVRNGTMLPAHNALVERIASGWSGRTFAAIGGSDAHTLRRIGRTWTEAPGTDVASFVASLRDGACRVAGAHGGTGAVAGDAYAVVGRYVASLFGFGPCEQPVLRRAACVAFSIVSLPGQSIPLAIVASGKRAEARAVAQVEHVLMSSLDQVPSPAAPVIELESQA